MTEFLKIHGLGNDFIVINELDGLVVPERKKKAFAKQYCNRKFSVGADGILFVQSSKKADFKMRVFNPDGSEPENCVNGLRCVTLAKYLWDHEVQKKYAVEITQGTVHATVLKIKQEKEQHVADIEIEYLGKAKLGKSDKIKVNDYGFDFIPVDVGNPHAVIFFNQRNIHNMNVETVGHAIEYSKQFAPERVNTEFVTVESKTKVDMRVHERGVCETQACGSGSIAVVLAGAQSNLLSENQWVEVKQPGGSLFIKTGKQILLRGAAELVFRGNLL
jgi:diaminopimelate epimerase